MQNRLTAIQNKGASVISVVVAPLESVENWCQSSGIGFPVLADSDHVASEAYGVYNLLGDKLATPAVFVIDTDGQIVWHYVARQAGDFVQAATIIDNLP